MQTITHCEIRCTCVSVLLTPFIRHILTCLDSKVHVVLHEKCTVGYFQSTIVWHGHLEGFVSGARERFFGRRVVFKIHCVVLDYIPLVRRRFVLAFAQHKLWLLTSCPYYTVNLVGVDLQTIAVLFICDLRIGIIIT